MGKPADIARLLPFLPRTLAEWYRAHPGETHTVSRHHGALVCLDASGFTALTGRLEARGEDGPEILTEILNAFFATVIDIARQHGGDVLKFSGDGLWLYLPNPHNVAPLAEMAQRSLQTLNSQHAFLKSQPISLHLGAELGTFDLVTFGDPQYRLEMEPVGPVVAEAYSCCDLAGPGQLTVGPKLTQLATETQPTTVPAEISATDEALEQAEQILWRYVPQTLLGRIGDGNRGYDLESEYRDVTIAFCQCVWDDQALAPDGESGSTLVGRMITCVQSCEGSLARIDPFKDGHKLLILFGAPVVRSDDQWRALECARRLAAFNRDGFTVRVGLAHGRAFCGIVGSSTRLEYTVMGSSANLAARLMAKADWGDVLFDQAMHGLLPGSVVSTPRELTVKGFTKPLTAYHFDHIDDHAATVTAESSLEELRHSSYQGILDRWTDTAGRGTRNAIFVHGGHGTGKSHLLRACERVINGKRFVSLGARQAIFFGPGHLARKLLLQLAAMNPEVERAGLRRWIESQGVTDSLPVLKGVVDDVPDDNIWTKDLSPQLRTQKAQDVYVELVGRLLDQAAFAAIDDLDKADAFSRSLILALCRADTASGLSFLITMSDSGAIVPGPDAGSISSFELTSPSEEEWRGYLTAQFVEGRREEEFIDRLISQSGRLPGIVFEFLAERIAAGELVSNPVNGRWELTHSMSPTAAPRSTRELHLERFDALPEHLRAILKVATVHPTEFTAELIVYETGESTADAVAATLNELSSRGILQVDPSGQAYQFANGSMRDAIYECIPRADLKTWHVRRAQWMEQHQSDRIALLAYHYASAQVAEKGFAYSLKAAQEALAMYALADAAHHFESCRRLMASDTASQIAISHTVEFHQALSQFLVLEGRPREAYRVFRTWRRLADRAHDTASALAAALGEAELLWQQSQYGRCTRVLQAALAKVPPHESPGLVARGMTLMAETARRTARFSEAESWARKALEQSDEPSVLADAYNRLGIALWGQGKLPEAVSCLQQSLSGGAHSMYNRARIANNLAIVHWQMGALLQAEPLMREAIEIFRRQGDRRNEAYARGNLAALIREFGKHADARRMLCEADVIFERLGDKHAHYYTVGNLGDIDLVSGDLDSARRRFAEALAFAESVDDGELQAECEVRLGEVAFFAGDMCGAERELTAAMELAEKIDSAEFALRARVGLARVKVGLKNTDSLLDMADRIRRDGEESRAAVVEQEGRFLQAEYFRITGDPAKAMRCYEEVFAYARDQRLFELSLKCAVRIAEQADTAHLSSGEYVVNLAQAYERDNGPGSWSRILDSAYFSFFRSTLAAITQTTNRPEVPLCQ